MSIFSRKRRATGLIPEPWAGTPHPARTLVSAVASSPELPLTAKDWATGPVLDQGSLGACGAFATTAEIIAEPAGEIQVPAALGNAHGFNMYARARVLGGRTPDESDGNTGTLLSWNLDACKERGLIGSWRRVETVEDLANVLVNEGPVVIALHWLACFESAEDNGLMAYVPGTKDRGYHALAVVGYDPAKVLPGVPVHVWEWVWHPIKSRKRRQRDKRRHPNRAHAGQRKSKVARYKPTADLPAEPMFQIRNSWGDSWGAVLPGQESKPFGRKRDGTGWLRVRDLRHLWDSGEAYAYAPVGRRPVDVAAVLAAYPDPMQPPPPPRQWS